MSVEVGDKAPNFNLPTDAGGNISLKDLKGETVILYFYPKDDTPGCTKEACAFRDALPDFSKAKAMPQGKNGVALDESSEVDAFAAPSTVQSAELGRNADAFSAGGGGNAVVMPQSRGGVGTADAFMEKTSGNM